MRTVLLAVLLTASAWPLGAEEGWLPRKVLVLLSDEDREEDRLRAHRNAEFVLNWLGLQVVYGSLVRPPPEPEMDGVLAVLVWIVYPDHPDPERFLGWLASQRAAGRKVLLMGAMPALVKDPPYEPVGEERYSSLIAPLGLRLDAQLDKDLSRRRLVVHDPAMTGFERRYEDRLANIAGLRSTDPANEVHLSVVLEGTPAGRADLVVTGPFGGVALDPAVMSQNQEDFQRKWVLDPFRFFTKALGLAGRPVPDTTTMNGRRVLYCHVDGDAFTGTCDFDKKLLCAEPLYKEVLLRHPYPHTLSLIAAWFDQGVKEYKMILDYDSYPDKFLLVRPRPEEREHWIATARQVFDHPWVEPALHGYGHPIQWEKGHLLLIADGRPYSPQDEFDTAGRVMSELLRGVQPRVFLWTGFCQPTGEQMAYAEERGLLHLNGGDGRMDAIRSSISNLAPLSRSDKGRIQVYSSAANENIFTNLWTGPFYGFKNVIETFRRTEGARRLLPVNIYYHWYSGEHKASLQALEEIYAWADSQPLVPVWASRHIRNVHGFFGLRLRPLADGGYEVADNGWLRTLRLEDRAEDPVVAGGRNVLGFLREGRRVYVHLGPAPASRLEWTAAGTPQPRLEWATCVVDDLRVTAAGATLDIWGLTKAEIRLADLPRPLAAVPGVEVVTEGKAALLRLHPDGRRTLELPWAASPAPARPE